MAAVARTAVTHPTSFSDRASIPGEFNPLQSYINPGSAFSFGPAGRASFSSDSNYNNGSTVANVEITSQFGVTFDEDWKVNDSHLHAFLFMKTRTNGFTKFACMHHTASLQALNRYLKSQAGMQLYGSDSTYRRLKRDWLFIGVQKGPIPTDIQWRGEKFSAVAVGGNTNVPDVTHAQESSAFKRGGAAMERDSMWFVYRRYACDDELDNIFSNSNNKRQKVGKTTRYYWQIEIMTIRGRERPSAHIYINDSTVGFAERVGTILQVNGSGKSNAYLRDTARDALKPDNSFEKNIEKLSVLPKLQLVLGIQ